MRSEDPRGGRLCIVFPRRAFVKRKLCANSFRPLYCRPLFSFTADRSSRDRP